MSDEKRAGWKWFYNSTRLHHFDGENTSACKKWMTFSLSDLMRSEDVQEHDKCAACRKVLAKKGSVKANEPVSE